MEAKQAVTAKLFEYPKDLETKSLTDTKNSSQLVPVLCSDNIWRVVPWDILQSGHIVQVQCKEYAPADLCLLTTSSEDHYAYIQTKKLDGDATVKLRKPLPLQPSLFVGLGEGLSEDGSTELLLTTLSDQIRLIAGEIKKNKKSKNIYKFTANLLNASDKEIKIDNDNFIPMYSNVLICNQLIGVCLYTGPNTKYALNGGEEGCVKLTENRVKKEEKMKEKRKKEAAEREKKKLEAQVPPKERIRRFELETGVTWEDTFTDVPDDGNCLMHAFWLGLKTLLERYPQLKLSDEPPLPSNPVSFRKDFFQKLKEDVTYRSAIREMFQLYIEHLEESYLICMEEFYTLPESLRNEIMTLKALKYQEQETGGDVFPVDYEDFENKYLQAMVQSQNINGREVYWPLGAGELTALCKIYSTRLQTMTTEGIFKSLHACTVEEIDPRCVESTDIHEFDRTQKRMVRLLNVKRHHYNVHLPAEKKKEKKYDDDDEKKMNTEKESINQTSFNSFQFWDRDDYSKMELDPNLLPELEEG